MTDVVEFITREKAGLIPGRARTYSELDRDKLKGVVDHYTSMAGDQQQLHSHCAQRWAAVQFFHMEGNGWRDIAYSFGYCWHGGVFEGRGWGVRTAANGTTPANDAYHAFVFLGADAKGKADLTPLAKQARRWLQAEHDKRYPDASEIVAHNDIKATGCPGAEIEAFVKSAEFRGEPEPVKPKPAVIATPAWYKRVLTVTAPLMRGGDVKAVQGKLKVFGPDGKPDGLYGALTAKAVLAWQKAHQASHKLEADGVVGPASAKALG